MKKTTLAWSAAAVLSGGLLLSSTQPALRAQTAPATVARTVADDDAALLRYQLALDQLAQGNVTAARVIAEEARRRSGDAPEINLLLAYLLEREGRFEEARTHLNTVATRSHLAARYATQLATQPNGRRPTAVAPQSGQRIATNTAASGATASNDVLYVAGTPARVAQNDKNLAALEQVMARLVNAERTKAGLSTLSFDATLAATARAHSVDMRDRNYFAHESKTTALREPLDRYRAVFKTTPSIVAENIYRSWGSPRRINQADIQTAHNALMNSPGHRSNILQPRVTRLGIGIVANANGDLWVTQMFART
ncbi:MAG TPA: CAP domain-containing protein [Abditibacteriaceae bacterium]|jgi:uncharacterized protein YkwD